MNIRRTISITYVTMANGRKARNTAKGYGNTLMVTGTKVSQRTENSMERESTNSQMAPSGRGSGKMGLGMAKIFHKEKWSLPPTYQTMTSGSDCKRVVWDNANPMTRYRVIAYRLTRGRLIGVAPKPLTQTRVIWVPLLIK